MACVILAIFLLQGCGGGDAERPEPAKILVNAGPDVTINEELLLSLLGDARESGNAGVSLTYEWSAQPSLNITQEDSSSGAATLTAPTVTTEQQFILTLTAKNEAGVQGSDTLNLTVVPINDAPVAIIKVYEATSSEEEEVGLEESDYAVNNFPILTNITLDGSDSTDTDTPTGAAAIASYSWQQTAGPSVIDSLVLTNPTLTFQSPLLQEDTQASFLLEVLDQEGAVAEQSVTLTFLAESNTIPTLEAGPSVTVNSGELISLSAEANSRARGAAPYSVTWSSDSDLAPIIDDFNSFSTFSIAPLVTTVTELVFNLTIEDSYGNQQRTTYTAMVLPSVQSRLNDTGVTLNATNVSIVDVYQSEFAGQDAQFGNDRVAESALLNKAGRGEGGFDFTRLNQNGDEVDQDTSDWRCVRDNITGLIWENKTNDSNDLHFADSTFTWYSEVDNGGFAGYLNSQSDSCNLDSASCNTQSFISAVNAEGLCGFFDWRLPTHTELLSLVHYGAFDAFSSGNSSYSPLIDTEYFPFMGSSMNQDSEQSDTTEFLWYWTSLPNVDGVNDLGAQSAWTIDFYSGVDNFIDKSSEFRVKLVRAGR
jgi:hypothetical protein